MRTHHPSRLGAGVGSRVALSWLRLILLSFPLPLPLTHILVVIAVSSVFFVVV